MKDSPIYLFQHILHRSLLLGNDNNYTENQDKHFLTDVLYLSMFLENFVLQSKLVIKEFPNILTVDSPFEVDNYYQMNLRTRTYLPVFFEDEDDYADTQIYLPEIRNDDSLKFSKRILSNPILKNINVDDIALETPNIQYAFQELFDLGEKLQEESLEFDFYTVMSLNEILNALKNGNSIIPDKTNDTKLALEYSKYKNNNLTDLLTKIYQSIDSKASDDLSRVAQYGTSRKVYLPPITSIIFNESKDISDILKIAYQLRTEFKGLRYSFSQYENQLSDDTVSLGKSLEALNELEFYTSELTKNYKSRTIADISEWKDISNITRFLDGAIDAADSSSLGSMLLGKPLQYINQKIKTRKVSYLFDIREQFYSIENYGQMIDKLFNKKLSDFHIDMAKKEGFDLNIIR